MTIKNHIAISAIISLALIALIACQQKPQAPKEEKGLNDKIKTQVTKVEDTAKKAQEAAAKAEAEAKEAAARLEERNKEIEEVLKEEEEKAKAKAKEAAAKAEEEAKKAAAKAKEVETTAKEKAKEIETNIKEASDKIKSQTNELDDVMGENAEVEEELGPQNLFANSDFGEGLKDWSSTPGVNFVQEDDQNFIELTGQEDKQTRVWQSFNATAGHIYRLTFKAKAEKEGGFAIFRDDAAETEKYLYTKKGTGWKEYSKEFTATQDGDYRLFLSCQGNGKFYYKDASLIDITDTKTEQ